MEQLDIGPELRRAREALGLSIEAAANATKIRARYIQALEEEDLAALPAPVFATGLLRAYSSYLGLDPNVMVARLNVEPEMRPRAAIESESGIMRPTTSITPGVLAAAVAAVALAAIAYLLYTQYTAYLAGERESHPATPVAAAGKPATTPTIGIAIVPPSPSTPTRAAAPAPTRQPQTPTPQPTMTPVPTFTPIPAPTVSDWVVIQAKFLDRVWVQIEVDDKVAASKTWNAGEQGEWRGKKVFLWTGNAYSVEVTYNGRSLGRLGARGELVKVTWTAR